jgi:hypothetical protein
MAPDKRKAAVAFGQELDLSDLEGFDINELLSTNTDLLKVDNGDPKFEYGWMDTRDPSHGYKIRKGLWEIVDASTDPVICAGSIKEGNVIRVNELMLVRMPKEKFQRMRLAWDAISLAKQQKIEARFHDQMQVAGQALGDDPREAITSDERVGVKVSYKGKK